VTRTRRCGFLLIDALVGITLIGMIVAMFAMASGQYRRSQRALSHQRAAVRVAEHTLYAMQTGGAAAPARDEDVHVTVSRVKGEAVDGRVWVSVEVHHHGQRAELVGLVPLAALKGDAP
jgi:type II secretory pathway pseudopilin PulG